MEDCLKLRLYCREKCLNVFTEYTSHARHFAGYCSTMMSSYLMIDTDKQNAMSTMMEEVHI